MVTFYCADVFCDDCGRRHGEELESLGMPAPGPGEIRDTDEWPSIGHPPEATDCPNHCGDGDECLNAITLDGGFMVGELLTEWLTDDGVDYVAEAIRDDISEGRTDSVAITVWGPAFDCYPEIRKALSSGDDPRTRYDS
jgi:hypothetical protein